MLYSSVLQRYRKVKIKNTWNDKVLNAYSYRNKFQAVVVLLEVWVWKKLKVSSRVKTKYWLEIRNESIYIYLDYFSLIPSMFEKVWLKKQYSKLS